MKSFKSSAWVLPQPVLIIGTYDKNGKPNAMNVQSGERVGNAFSDGGKNQIDMKKVLSLILFLLLVTGMHAQVDTLALNHPEYLPSLAIGEQAPDFTAADTLGNSISLSQYRGRYVVLDFWATWCGDCRREIPFLKELYNDVKDKEIGDKRMQWLSLSFDTKREQWVSILRKEKFPWAQISTLKSRKEDPTFNNFKLNWIPAFFILDPDGKVVAKAITADGLRAEINKL